MFNWLAQTVPATRPTAPPRVISPEAVNYLRQWGELVTREPRQFLVALGITAASLAVGYLAAFVFRRLLARYHIQLVTNLLIVALAIYSGLWTMAPEYMDDPNDHVANALHRVFVAIFLLIFLRLLDWVVIKSALTRGGRVPLPRFIHQVIIGIVYLFAILGYANYAFNFPIDRILAGSAVLSIVLGLALQESLGNLFSGMVMQAAGPFAIGDWIETTGVEGRVVDMTWRAVTLLTGNNNYVLIPNSSIAKEKITNYHSPTMTTSRNVVVGVDYKVPPRRAIEVLVRALHETPGVLKVPAPGASAREFGDSAINYICWFFIDDPSKHWGVEDQVRMNIWYRLNEAGISIPYPTRSVEVVDAKAAAEEQNKRDVQERFRALSRSEMFAPLAEDLRLKLAQDTRSILLAPGQVLYREEEFGNSLYLIQRGEIDIYASRNGSAETLLVTLHAGEFFGEMTAMTGQPRATTSRARSDAVLIEITKDHLQEAFQADQSFMQKMVDVVETRKVAREERLQALAKAQEMPAAAQAHHSLADRVRGFFGVGRDGGGDPH